MKRKCLSLLLATALSLGLLSGCGNVAEQPQEQSVTEEETVAEQPQEQSVTEEETVAADEDALTIRVASLKGPTSMGLVKLWKDQEDGNAEGSYEFSMMTAADEILPLMIKGEMDIALIPANAAAILYQKSEGAVSVIDINTLGVLYMVSGDDTITSVADLKGKTIYLTGKGTTPDYALQYLLAQNGIDLSEITLEYKSEATEVAALLQENPDSIGLLPQPFVTAACAQNEALQVVLDINGEWEALNDGKGLVTGVTVVRKDFLEQHPDAVELFMKEHRSSAEFANTNVEEAAELVAESGIIEKAAVAAKAMPACNITYIDGEEMKEALSGYLDILYGQSPESVGGALPEDDFYTIR